MPRFFGAKLRFLRHQARLTQTELAHQLALKSHAHISNVEAGSRTASLDVVLRVARFFGVTLDYLLRDSIAVESAQLTRYPAALHEVGEPALFGPKIRHLRAQQQLNQGDFARRLQPISQAHVSYLEAGKKEPSIAMALQIADLFGVTLDYLLRDDIPVS